MSRLKVQWDADVRQVSWPGLPTCLRSWLKKIRGDEHLNLTLEFRKKDNLHISPSSYQNI